MAQGQGQGRPPLQPRRLSGDGSGCESAGAKSQTPSLPALAAAQRPLPGTGGEEEPISPRTRSWAACLRALGKSAGPAAAGAPVAPDRIPAAKGPAIFLRGLRAARGSSWACKAPGGVGGAFTGREVHRAPSWAGRFPSTTARSGGARGGEKEARKAPPGERGRADLGGAEKGGPRTRSMLGQRSGRGETGE